MAEQSSSLKTLKCCKILESKGKKEAQSGNLKSHFFCFDPQGLMRY